MLHHIEIYVSDLERSVAFWTPFMKHLGYEADRWSGGMNYVKEEAGTYLCFLQAPPGTPVCRLPPQANRPEPYCVPREVSPAC